MIPAEYQALVRAWRKKERRTAEWFATIAVVTSQAHGGKLEMGDLLDDMEEGE